MIPPPEYMSLHYQADFQTFGSTLMCGFSMADVLKNPKKKKMHGIVEFTLSQFGLNLLNQATHAHCPSHCYAWKQFSPPFADTHGCFSGHGMRSHIPHSILRFAQDPFFGSGAPPGIVLTWPQIEDYTTYFLRDMLEAFMRDPSGEGFPKELFYDSIQRDYDCIACCRTLEGWESRHVMSLINKTKKGNKSLEPTRFLVTDRAFARSAPRNRAAHL